MRIIIASHLSRRAPDLAAFVVDQARQGVVDDASINNLLALDATDELHVFVGRNGRKNEFFIMLYVAERPADCITFLFFSRKRRDEYLERVEQLKAVRIIAYRYEERW